MSNLFLDRTHVLKFEKLAMPTKLSDTPDAWQREAAAEVYKQLPYIADYAVNVILERVDAERGFAFGGAHISPKSESPMKEQKELPHAVIPLIIKERMLAPLDVFMDGESVFPLTEERLREKLFRTDTFETSTRKPSDRGMIDQLYPPMRTNYGMGSVAGDAMGIGKTANAAEAGRRQMIASMKADAAANPNQNGLPKEASLIEAIAPTIPDVEADALVGMITEDPAMLMATAKNEAFQKLAKIIAGAPRVSLEKRAGVMVDSIQPTVVQLQKLASGDFRVKWANAGAFAPQEGVVSPDQANSMAGADLASAQPGATVTVGTEKAKQPTMEGGYKPVADYGTYKALDAGTNEPIQGWVFPVMDFDMHPLELFVFVGPQSYAVQDEIAGIRMPDAEPPMITQPQQGDGVLVFQDGAGFKALLPMTIRTMSQGPQGMLIEGETLDAEPIMLTGAQIEVIQKIDEGHYAVPSTLLWVPLANPIHLVKSSEDTENIAAGQASPGAVDLKSTGNGEFHMDGAPLNKVAGTEKSFISTADAEFLLVGMGLDPFTAREKLAEAQKTHRTVKIAGLRSIIPLSDLHRDMVKKAAATLSNFPYHLKRDLIKEAAVLEDGDTTDKVLAMNFLNPENISTFAKYLPDLDEASSKLAEMLVASRLGMGQVDEGAIERAMKNLEEVISGLKLLQHQNMV